MTTHILYCQGQSKTNAVSAQDYGKSALGSVLCLSIGIIPQGTMINLGADCSTLRKLRSAFFLECLFGLGNLGKIEFLEQFLITRAQMPPSEEDVGHQNCIAAIGICTHMRQTKK
ncbi:hypothetical protein TNCV_2490441 [Trichonephila clavipes]|nr:hypothetical protein TNCV_2490441 [Trichonephila clavipes]